MKAYDNNLRQEVIALFESGQKRTAISKDLGISYGTVREWIKRYKLKGISGLAPHYNKCGGSAKVSAELKQAAIDMKEDHEEWGAEYIRLQLSRQYAKDYIPSARQLQRYFRSSIVVKTESILPKADKGKGWAKQVFERVQVDAKEQLQTNDGEWCSYLTFTEERTGAVLETLVFPL